MNNCFRRKKVLIYNKISKHYNYLQAKLKITYPSDPQFNVLNLKVDIDDNCTEEIRVQPNKENFKKWNIIHSTSLTISHSSFTSCSKN